MSKSHYVSIIMPEGKEFRAAQAAHDTIASKLYADQLRYDARVKMLRLVLRSCINIAIPIAAIAELSEATSDHLVVVELPEINSWFVVAGYPGPARATRSVAVALHSPSRRQRQTT